ncbi:MAG: MBL fold metallo-hydrolase [Gammaproteobacteria bacterium]|nr:MBL fold metallo-hydrolase [Gammaproteobacteria bacterium]
MQRGIVYTAILAAVAAPAQAQDEEIRIQSTEVVPGLYMLEGADGKFAGGNMGLLVGDDGVVLIDDGLEPTGPALLAAIADLTGAPVDYLINTHVHGDHVGSNAAIHDAGATIVAHDNIRSRMADDAEDPAPAAALPEITFNDSVTLHINGMRLHVMHVANAHTDGDGVILFPDVNVIHTGDVLFNGLFPFIDMDSGGSVEGYIAAQDRLLAIADDDTIFIPGHGPLARKADLQRTRDMIADCYARVSKLVSAGKSADEIVAANPLADYHDRWNWDFITTERMTRSMARAATR